MLRRAQLVHELIRHQMGLPGVKRYQSGHFPMDGMAHQLIRGFAGQDHARGGARLEIGGKLQGLADPNKYRLRVTAETLIHGSASMKTDREMDRFAPFIQCLNGVLRLPLQCHRGLDRAQRMTFIA